MPGLQLIPSFDSVNGSSGPKFGEKFEESPCSSPGLPMKRRLKREPVRGPESALDSRFDTGITFSFGRPGKLHDDICKSVWAEMRIISRQFGSSIVPSTDIHRETTRTHDEYPWSSSPTFASVENSGRESECESEMEFEDDALSYDDDAFASVTKQLRVVKPISRPSTSSLSRKPKQCACCGCTSTPLWRDMGKDMPLCNACGIRWKKYGVVCDECQYVPCKQERENKHCKRCSAQLPPANKRIRPASPLDDGAKKL